MVLVERTVTLPCSADELLEFVMDVDRYAEVDDKIAPIHWSRRDGDVVEFRCRPRMVGVRLPAVVQRMHLTPRRRIDIGLVGPPANRLARLVARFRASFACRHVAEGVELTRTLEFRFTAVTGLLGEPVFRRWLPLAVDRELDVLHRHVAGGGLRTDARG